MTDSKKKFVKEVRARQDEKMKMMVHIKPMDKKDVDSLMTSDTMMRAIPDLSDYRDLPNVYMMVFKIEDIISLVTEDSKTKLNRKLKTRVTKNIRKLSDKVMFYKGNLYIAMVPTKKIDGDTVENIANRITTLLVTEMSKALAGVSRLPKVKIAVIELKKKITPQKIMSMANKIFEECSDEKPLVIKIIDNNQEQKVVIAPAKNPAVQLDTDTDLIALVAK